MLVEFLKSAAEAAEDAVRTTLEANRRWIVTAVEEGRQEDAAVLAHTIRQLEDAARAFRQAFRSVA